MTTNHTITTLCLACGREEEATTVTRQFQRDGQVFVFRDIPARVCTACGAVFFTEEVLQQIDGLIEAGNTEPAPVNKFLVHA